MIKWWWLPPGRSLKNSESCNDISISSFEITSCGESCIEPMELSLPIASCFQSSVEVSIVTKGDFKILCWNLQVPTVGPLESQALWQVRPKSLCFTSKWTEYHSVSCVVWALIVLKCMVCAFSSWKPVSCVMKQSTLSSLDNVDSDTRSERNRYTNSFGVATVDHLRFWFDWWRHWTSWIRSKSSSISKIENSR